MSVEELPSRGRLIELVALHTCTRNCWGREGYSASCCTLEDRDWIQGPVVDSDAFLERLSVLRGRDVPYEEVFVDLDEGQALFPGRPSWRDPNNYPAIRPVMDEAAGFPCPFLGPDRSCTVYEARPAMCSSYRCDHLTKVLDVL